MPRRFTIHAGHVIAFDGRGHRLLRDGTVIVEGDRIVSVGRRQAASAETGGETVDARDAILTPGLISTHAHIGGSPLDRSFIEDRGNPQFFYSGLFELLPVRGAAQDEEATRACVDFSMAELLRGGVTTVMEIGGQGEYVVERAADFGLRVYVGLAFRSGRWLTRDGRRAEWEWDEEQDARGSPAPSSFTRSTTAATATSCAASSRRRRSTRARPTSCRRPSAPPTSGSGPGSSTPRSPSSSSTRCWAATARRPSRGSATSASSARTRSSATPSSSAARPGPTIRQGTSRSWPTPGARSLTRSGSSPGAES